jgi:Domain of unknown function (DUF4442)
MAHRAHEPLRAATGKFSGEERQLTMARTAKQLRNRLRLYSPYLGAGVRVTHIAEDFRSIQVEMPLRFYNKNYVGTHFGGSLYSMCDPFYMLMLIELLGPDYIVWDKAASIRFKRPGRGLVRARFEISEDKLAEIRSAANSNGKVEPEFLVQVKDTDDNVIAEVQKLLYVRRKS